jgi:hypothetical protein
VSKLKRSDGTWCNDLNEMKGMVREFIVDLFKADQGVSPHQVLNLIEAKVSHDMNV